VLPPTGVYAARTRLRDRTLRAVLNIGRRPTLQHADAPLRVEAHLLDFNADLYGEELEFVFVSRLRDEETFASVDELRKQIALDVEEAKRCL